VQLIAGRQRPGEVNGHGDFLRHHNINTSFPGGHAMFTWAMASVVAHEYPKTWVKVLAYSGAFAITTVRFLDAIIGAPTCSWAPRSATSLVAVYFTRTPDFSEACHPALARWGLAVDIRLDDGSPLPSSRIPAS
jgi:hypothetical protein